MAEHICDICIHEQACAAWVRHCTALYEDFRYSTDNCPYFQLAPVHCKDCKHYHEAQGWCDKHSHFDQGDWEMFYEDDYCSCGESK